MNEKQVGDLNTALDAAGAPQVDGSVKDTVVVPFEQPVDAAQQLKDSALLSAEEILDADDITTVDVEVPEWGKGRTVRLRAMSGEEAVLFVKAIQGNEKEGKTSQAIKIVGLCAVKADGSPLFTEMQVSRLAKKSLRALMRLQTKAMEINGLDEVGTKAAKND